MERLVNISCVDQSFIAYIYLSLTPNEALHKSSFKPIYPFCFFVDKLSERNVAGMEFCTPNCALWKQYPF